MKQTWEYKFEIDLNDIVVGVKLDEQVHGYGYWQLKGLSCVHALACINTIRDTNMEKYTHLYFHTKT